MFCLNNKIARKRKQSWTIEEGERSEVARSELSLSHILLYIISIISIAKHFMATPATPLSPMLCYIEFHSGSLVHDLSPALAQFWQKWLSLQESHFSSHRGRAAPYTLNDLELFTRDCKSFITVSRVYSWLPIINNITSTRDIMYYLQSRVHSTY